MAGVVPGGARSGATLAIGDPLRALFAFIASTFVPLMVQNAAAYDAARAAGETRFNEWAFNRNRALYDGELHGQPFRAVVKTFQVRVWRDLRAAWAALDGEARSRIRRVLPDMQVWEEDSTAD
jgi:hypothetical protein